uniref:Sp6 transcription factor n=1 Tax=Nothobranchius kuhntae TaxID=321403 RepID=A0A1A8JP14_NOTKU
MAHPYEPWLRTTPSSGNSDEMNISSWWDLHRDVQAGSWIDLQTGQGVGLPSVSQGSSMGLQPSLGPYGSDPQLCTLPPVQHAPASHSSHLFPQDGFKMEPLGPDMLQQETFSLDEPQETSVSARPKPQRRSSSRGGGQAVCRCPNCAGTAATGHLSATGSSVARGSHALMNCSAITSPHQDMGTRGSTEMEGWRKALKKSHLHSHPPTCLTPPSLH